MKAIILSSIGTPRNTSSEAVADYIRNYLGDKHVISAPQPIRRRIIEKRILPGHLPHSVARYTALSDLYGGELPLRIYGERLRLRLQQLVGDTHSIYNFSLHEGKDTLTPFIQKIQADGPFSEITIFSLYPHHTFSSSISTIEPLKASLKFFFPETTLHIVHSYWSDKRYISAIVKRIQERLAEAQYDHIAISFHSIPLVHQWCGCWYGFNYFQQCKKTAQLITQALPTGHPYTGLYFQSAIGKKWLKPNIEQALPEWLRLNYKRVLVACPGFLMDCLENVYDIGVVLQKQFIEVGGECCSLAESLNDSTDLAELIAQLVQEAESTKKRCPSNRVPTDQKKIFISNQRYY